MRDMSYSDFWFIDTRVQTVNLRRYFLWFILLFAFVSVGCYFAIVNMYNDMELYGVRNEQIQIAVYEAKSTNVNGYVKGEIVNTSEEEIDGKYLCFLLFNDMNNLEDVQYIEIGAIAPAQKETFEMKFKTNNVTGVYILTTDNMETFKK